MADDALLKKWLDEGLITSEQYEKMLLDVVESQKDSKSGSIVSFMGTFGSILLGIGVILFIAANWQNMSNVVKIGMVVSASFASLWSGYWLGYEKASLPKIGNSLIFLSSILYGASILLVAQIYNISANNHTIVFLWFVGVLPLVYILKSRSISFMSLLLFYLWFVLMQREVLFTSVMSFRKVVALLVLISIFIFEFGGLHYLKKGYHSIARTYRMFTMPIIMAFAFVCTFRGMAKYFSKSYQHTDYKLEVVVLSLILFTLFFIYKNFTLNPFNSTTHKYEEATSLAILLLVSSFYFFPIFSGGFYTLLFNIFYLAAVGLLIYVGYEKRDTQVLDKGLGFLSVMILARYFDFFYEFLPKSIFFLVGGALILTLGIFLEKQRRKIRNQLKETR